MHVHTHILPRPHTLHLYMNSIHAEYTSWQRGGWVLRLSISHSLTLSLSHTTFQISPSI